MEQQHPLLPEINSLPEALAVINQLLEIIGRQQEQIAALEAEIKRLRDQQNLDSQNSSKPPSSDKNRKKRQTKSLRRKTGRKPGGQKGHEGKTLRQVEHPDATIVHPVSICRECGQDLSSVASTRLEKRQVFDIPPLKLDVTEHQAEIKTCPCCAQETRAEFPASINQPVQYGPRVKGFLVYLNQEQLIPYERTTILFEDLFGQPVSQGTLLNTTEKCYQNLAPIEANIKQTIQESDVVHFDETGLYETGKRIWLHSASTPTETFYFAHEKRGKDGMDAAGILPNFFGKAVHDHWAAYQNYDECDHAFCNTHHLRELERAFEQDNAQWADNMKDLLLQIKETVDDAKARGQTKLPNEQVDDFNRQYREIVDTALDPYLKEQPTKSPPKRGRKKQTKVKNLLDRFDKYQTETLMFMTDFNVPFDNNLAERDIRMIKVKQKISGTFRAKKGSQFFCRIRGYISTLKKRKQNILETLTLTFTAEQAV